MRALGRVTLWLTAVTLLAPAALGQFPSEIVGFNGPPIDDEVTAREMFRQPDFSGSTVGFILPNSAGVFDNHAAYRASGLQTEGAAAMQVFFKWADPADPNAWLRLATYNGPERPNPALHLQGKVRFKIVNRSELFAGRVGICIGVRETDALVPQLYDGGVTGAIEWVGVSGAATDPNGVPLRPIPIVYLDPSPVAYSVEFNLANGQVKVDGVLQGAGFAGFTGDGTLSSPNNRGTLEHIAFVNDSADSAQLIDVAIDELQFEAPAADPVIPPTIVGPIINGDPNVVVTGLLAGVNQVSLYRDGNLVEARNVATTDDVNFDISANPAVTGQVFTATQRVGTTVSGFSLPETVLVAAPAYSFSIVLDEDGNGSCAPTGVWEFLGVTATTSAPYPTGISIIPNNAVWQTIDFSLTNTDFIRAWPGFGGNGVIDPSPSGKYTIDSLWFALKEGEATGPYEVLIDKVELLDGLGNVMETIHDFENGITYMTNVRGQSTTPAISTSQLSTLAAYNGNTSHRFVWTFGGTSSQTLGVYHNIQLNCGTGPQFSDQGETIRFHMVARAPLVNALPLPVVVGPIVGTQTAVRIQNDPTATAVQLYVNGNPVGLPKPPTGSVTDFASLTLNVGDSVSATQTIGADTSDYAYPKAVNLKPIPPVITTPVIPGATTVNLTGLATTPFASASQVKVTVNNGTPVFATPSGATVNVTVAALQSGDVVRATQTVNGAESDPAQVTVVFGAPVIYAAPGEGDTSVRVQGLPVGATQVTVTITGGATFNAAVPNGATFVDVPVSGLVAGQEIKATYSVGGVGSVESAPETVTIGTRTTLLCENFEIDDATYIANWTESAAPRPILTTDQNYTSGGQKSIYNAGNAGRVNRLATNTTPSATNPLVWNVAIYDTQGTAGTGENFCQAISNNLTANFWLMHVGMSALVPGGNQDYYQFRGVGHGGPNWIDLKNYDGPQRSIGWHVFTTIVKGNRIDVYVDGKLAAKNITLIDANTRADLARIGPGAGLPSYGVAAYYDDYCLEQGKLRFAPPPPPPPPNPPVIGTPAVAGDTQVVVKNLDATVTSVVVRDQANATLGAATGPFVGGTTTVSINRALVFQEKITAAATNPSGTTGGAALEVGNGVGPILLCIGVRETGDTGLIGTPGSTSGTMEFVGATGVVSGAPQGQPIAPSPNWQTITITPSPSNVFAFTGNGILDGTRGVLEHLAISVDANSPTRSTGPYTLWIDNVVNVGAGTITDFEGFPADGEVLFQEPTYSGSTAANLGTTPSSSATVTDEGNPGQSQLLEWFWLDTTAPRWIRVTTNGVANRPSPIIDLTKPIQLDVLLTNPQTGPTVCLGDVNCDGSVTFADIDPFVARLGCPNSNPTACNTPANCTWLNADINEDGAVTFADIDPFVSTLGDICP